MRGRLRQARAAVLKSPREIELMRRAGRVVFDVLTRMRELVAPGVTTREMNEVAEQMISAAAGEALFKGVKTPQTAFPFPAALCTSVNEVVVHGVPSDQALKQGDIVSVDCGVRLGGFCGDSATTIPVGSISPEAEKLLQVTKESLQIAVDGIKPKRWWSEIAGEIQSHVESAGFTVVREFVGHGIGREMHEEPKIPNYVDRRQDFVLQAGMVLAIEPMVNSGKAAVCYADATNWPVATQDGQYAAHFEHTIAVTEQGADVLTIA